MANVSLFKEINNALFDLQNAQLQTYERPLRRLAQLLETDDLRPAVETLTGALDLDGFLEGQEDGGGMVGSEQLVWPEPREDQLGLTLLLIRRFGGDPGFLLDFGHTYYYAGSKYAATIHSVVGQLLIPFARDFRTYVENMGQAAPRLILASHEKIFVVHGHDAEARLEVTLFIERLGLQAVVLEEQVTRGQTVIEKVEAHADVGFAVVLLTPDDFGAKRGDEPEPRARQNVLLELGYFIGRLGRSKVCVLKRGEVEVPSDFAGTIWTTMDAGGGWKLALGRELEAAGYAIEWNRLLR